MQYVLNASNHAPSVPLPDFVSFHHYASASARDGGDAQGTAYDAFFSSADAWLNDVTTIMAIRDKMSPATMLDADEVRAYLCVSSGNNKHVCGSVCPEVAGH